MYRKKLRSLTSFDFKEPVDYTDSDMKLIKCSFDEDVYVVLNNERIKQNRTNKIDKILNR